MGQLRTLHYIILNGCDYFFYILSLVPCSSSIIYLFLVKLTALVLVEVGARRKKVCFHALPTGLHLSLHVNLHILQEGREISHIFFQKVKMKIQQLNMFLLELP